MKERVKMSVNSSTVEIDVEPRETLLDVLREELHLTGTHAGCEQGACGACTILVNGETVRSCLLLAVQARDAEITTIEGVAQPGALHPIQEALIEHHGLQCGYCTPGMVLAALELLERTPEPSREDIGRGMAGNLCRCTGYTGIFAAIEAAASAMAADDGDAR